MARSGLKEDALADRNKDSSSHDQTWLRQKKQMGRIIDVGERAAWLRLVFLRGEMWKAKKKKKKNTGGILREGAFCSPFAAMLIK